MVTTPKENKFGPIRAHTGWLSGGIQQFYSTPEQRKYALLFFTYLMFLCEIGAPETKRGGPEILADFLGGPTLLWVLLSIVIHVRTIGLELIVKYGGAGTFSFFPALIPFIYRGARQRQLSIFGPTDFEMKSNLLAGCCFFGLFVTFFV